MSLKIAKASQLSIRRKHTASEVMSLHRKIPTWKRKAVGAGLAAGKDLWHISIKKGIRYESKQTRISDNSKFDR